MVVVGGRVVVVVGGRVVVGVPVVGVVVGEEAAGLVVVGAVGEEAAGLVVVGAVGGGMDVAATGDGIGLFGLADDPGWSLATTTPMHAVTPPARTIVVVVIRRTRA